MKKKYTPYDDLYLECLQNELELATKSSTEIEELRLLKRRIILLDKIFESKANSEELIAKREYVINNKKYSLIERASLDFDLAFINVKRIILEDDLRVTEQKLNSNNKTR